MFGAAVLEVILDVLGVFIIAFAISYLVTPFMIHIATRFNIMDRPTKKKSHVHATPLLGGIAIYLGYILALLHTIYAEKALVGALFGGTLLILYGGIIDDLGGMSPRRKIRWQLIAALFAAFIASRMGLKVVFIKGSPVIAGIFTILWVIAMTNSFNLLDNLNGLSAGIGGISAFFFGIIALIQGDTLVAVVSLALMGACFGFLLHNFPKAKIFMGDAGSLFLGFMLAFIAVWGSWKTHTLATSLAIPILILGYPIFDTALVIFKRIQKGRSIFRGGKDHSSHRLAILKFRKISFRKKKAVLALYIVNSALGMAALAVTFVNPFWGYTIIIMTAGLMLLFGIRLGGVRIKYKD